MALWVIGSGLALGGLVVKIYPPPPAYRPVAYTAVTLIIVLGGLIHPVVMALMAKLPGAPLIVFLVTGGICSTAYLLTRHQQEPPPPSSNVTPPTAPSETPPQAAATVPERRLL